jgi:hypothetical protein
LTAAALALLAVGLTGCISIKSRTTLQRAPGVVSLRVVLCPSDYISPTTYTTCNPSNVADLDQLRADADQQPPTFGQVLVGFRVPDGSTGPDSFLSEAQDVGFSRSATYTSELTRLFPPPAGFHWEGYISTGKTFDPSVSATRETAFHPEFTLPSQAGAPSPTPFRWRVVAGFRAVNPGDTGNPVTCTGIFNNFCADSPPNGNIATPIQSPISDFGVLPATAVTAGQTETASVTFPFTYRDSGGVGARDFSFTATTTVPGATATPSVTALRTGNGTTNVTVSVPVPAGTPLGDYSVTLSSSTDSPPVTRSNSATITVVDKLAPGIRISAPAEGAAIVVGQAVRADFACAEELNGSGLRSCTGPVASGAAIDTATVGTKTFKVDASDNAGNASSATRTYRVVARPPDRIVVTLSFDFVAARDFTIMRRLQVRRVPSGSRVTATCSFKGKRCGGKARKSFSKRRASGTVSLASRFVGVRIRVGSKITVKVTKPGTIGAVKILTVRSSRSPRLTDRCLPVGSNRPRVLCGGET